MTRISVIVPVYNDPEGLSITARSLLAQDYPADRAEILLVDNGSTDDTFRLAEELAAQEPTRVRALAEREIRGSYAARNKAVAAARGEILCFIDADMRVPPDYLAAVARRFEDPACRYLGCLVDIEAERAGLAADLDRILGFPIDGYISRLHYAPTCCLSVRASLFEEVGAFDAALESGGDLEFGRRVHERGIGQDLLAGVRLVHPARSSLGALAKKRRRIARGHAMLLHRHGSRFEDLAGTYLWRRIARSMSARRLRERARERGVALSVARSHALASIQLFLNAIGTYEYRRTAARLRAR
jgi:glycosyltransferase involved in cell wall biosynthesis